LFTFFQFQVEDFQLRTEVGYDNNCTDIANSEVDISAVYGINVRSVLNNSRYYHVIGGLPGDAMHDVLEGLLQYETKEFLRHAVNIEKYFHLDDFNQWLKDFDYGYMNASNRPSTVASKTLNSPSNSLKQRGL